MTENYNMYICNICYNRFSYPAYVIVNYCPNCLRHDFALTQNFELERNMEKRYIIVREPGTVSEHNPSELLTAQEAEQKAEMYACKYNKTFYVAKLVVKFAIERVKRIEIED